MQPPRILPGILPVDVPLWNHGWMKRVSGTYGLRPLHLPDSRFKDGDQLNFGEVNLKAIRLPGHLTDHYGFFDETNNVLLSTDIDFSGFGPWYGHIEADVYQFMTDVKKLRSLNAGCVCSSHKPPMRKGIKEQFNRFLNGFYRQKSTILDLCRKQTRLETIVGLSPFYHNRFPDRFLQNCYEETMIKKNLALLEAEEQISFHQGGIIKGLKEDIHETH